MAMLHEPASMHPNNVNSARQPVIVVSPRVQRINNYVSNTQMTDTDENTVILSSN